MFTKHTFLPALLFLSVAASASQPPPPLVSLSAAAYSTGNTIWKNSGSLGNFHAIGHPLKVKMQGVEAVELNGRQNAFTGPLPGPLLSGNAQRTISLWVYSPRISSPEEAMVCMGKRGGPSGTLLAFGWGSDPAYGAVAHWVDDMGWNGPPMPGRWHYLAYTFDGKTAKVYDDGVLKNSLQLTLHTPKSYPVLIGAETSAAGRPQFTNEFTQGPLAGQMDISTIVIRPYALSAAGVRARFLANRKRYHARLRDAMGYLAYGTQSLQAGPFTLTLLNRLGVAAGLTARQTGFNFLPLDRLLSRSAPGYFQLGDCTLRVRERGMPWHRFSSADRAAMPYALHNKNTLLSQNITPQMGASCPVQVTRSWKILHGKLALSFRIYNPTRKTLQLGEFGIPMVFNNILTGRTLTQAHVSCVFADPAICQDAGYVQVTRLNGHGPALLVTPYRRTPLEAYGQLKTDPTPRDVTFEGFYQWMTCTKAMMHSDWKQVHPFNVPTMRVLLPGGAVRYTLMFSLSPSVQAIQTTLAALHRPVFAGIPGYVFGTDETAHLFVHENSPIASIACIPAGSMRIAKARRTLAAGWMGYTLHGLHPGRCRIEVHTKSGALQTVCCRITSPQSVQVRRYGRFMAEHQWYADPQDPFHRTDSFMPYNLYTHSMVLQHSHTWFSGLSDEIGAGASVGMAALNLEKPDVREIHLLDTYVQHTLWGHVQNKNYSVRASLFYYDPKALPNFHYTVHEGWDKARSETTWRSFNYPHVVSVYWSLYRIARTHPDIKLQQPWQWYLNQAWRTTMAVEKYAPGYAATEGLMVGSCFVHLLHDLHREGWNRRADAMQQYMQTREKYWASKRYPFGSEMPWDSTGQEEIYSWFRFFHNAHMARVTVRAVLGYMPCVPNWAYNGAARRYWDAPVNGTQWQDIVRMTNHYGSGINAIPIMDDYRRHPSRLLLLQTGYAGYSQLMANINRQGFASYGFDADASILKFDPNTADYGIAFYGYSREAAAYAVKSRRFGWLGFGCNTEAKGSRISIVPTDGFHKRLFAAPFGLWARLEAGTIQKAVLHMLHKRVVLTLAPSGIAALLRIQQTTAQGAAWRPAQKLLRLHGCWVIPPSSKSRRVVLIP